ncbi:MAG: alpha/beta hydrolase family protein [Paracholeplasma sp.]|uniref:Putative esterase n=1 Tax=Acholeplasma brassicae TaxID=61635 RepID=U4KP35_9MOLU|nr:MULTISPECIES: alpha/beta hydrolase family protein [Paracholeplasma]MDY3196394.1 alpha/beta hydrolase family protein [Paracholeplasma sp.]CCV66187.1 Putative esterase [Paracholeplasma brassicae]
MAFLQVEFGSAILQQNMQLSILMPQDIKQDEELKVLYLLHGYSGSSMDWIKLTGLERYLRNYRVMVVMPSMHNSYYSNAVYGYGYFDYYTKELPTFIESTFSVSRKKENRYIAGLSMGGYGAFKAALTYPERYHKAASFSGAMNVETMRKLNQTAPRKGAFDSIFGFETSKDTPNDLHFLASSCKTTLPELYFSCGKQDFLYQDNLAFKKHLENLGIPFVYEESDGDHNWDFWDTYIQKALKFMFDK